MNAYGVATSLILLVIKHWLDRRKEIRLARMAAIARWRTYIHEDFDRITFQDSVVNSEMKTYLSDGIKKELEPRAYRSDNGSSPFPVIYASIAGIDNGRSTLKARVLEEVARIERDEWKLI